MSINWDFNRDHLGTVSVEQTIRDKTEYFTLDIYSGNCLAIFVYNYEEGGKKMYQLANFFMDKDHAKRCLGLDRKVKDAENLLDRSFEKYMTFRLNDRKESRALAKLLMDAKWSRPVTIIIDPTMDA